MLEKSMIHLVVTAMLALWVPSVMAAETPIADTEARILLLTRAVARLQTEIDTLKQQQSLNQQLGSRVTVLDREMDELRQMLAGALSLPAPRPGGKSEGQPVKTYFVPAGW